MRISDDRYDRDLRRYNLARRMLQHEVRTATIVVWTGLSKYRIQTLFRSYQGTGGYTRHRGKSPFQPAFFLRSLLHECESSALTYIALQMEIIPAEIVPDAATSLPSLARGERLVNAFELYRALAPHSRLSLEHAVLLVTELAHRQTLSLGYCDICDGLRVVDRLAVCHALCAFCRLSQVSKDMGASGGLAYSSDATAVECSQTSSVTVGPSIDIRPVRIDASPLPTPSVIPATELPSVRSRRRAPTRSRPPAAAQIPWGSAVRGQSRGTRGTEPDR
jgi:hypothetical protein